MLGAFFGAPYRNWWISYAQSPEATSPYHTHWLVRKSAGGAFASGRVRLDRLQPSMIEVRTDLQPFCNVEFYGLLLTIFSTNSAM
jgi:hypothetical protein